MGILFVAGFSPIVDDPAVGQAFYTDTLGLPLVTVSGDYMTMGDLGGTRHLGIWPLADAVESCFGSGDHPPARTRRTPHRHLPHPLDARDL